MKYNDNQLREAIAQKDEKVITEVARDYAETKLAMFNIAEDQKAFILEECVKDAIKYSFKFDLKKKYAKVFSYIAQIVGSSVGKNIFKKFDKK